MKIEFKRLHPLFQIPKKATKLACGFDVVVTEIVHKSPSKVYCKLGFACKLPDDYKLELVPRSSLTKTNWVMNNSPGQGDADYPGEYQMRFTCIPSGIDTKFNEWEGKTYHLTYDKFPYGIGDRVGQVFVTKVEQTEWCEVEELTYDSDREGGFGSTGK